MNEIEDHLKEADELARRVVGGYTANLCAGNADSLTAEATDVFNKAKVYETARMAANAHRESPTHSELAKRAFAREILALQELMKADLRFRKIARRRDAASASLKQG